MSKWFFACVFGVFAVGALLVGCGGSDANARTITGTWRTTGVSLGNYPFGTDDACPIAVTGELVTPDTPRNPVTFNCGADDTFTFNTEGTFTVTTEARSSGTASTAEAGFNTATINVANLPQNPVVRFTGRWIQNKSQVFLTVNDSPTPFPYTTELTLQNPDQISAPIVGFPSKYDYVLKRQ